MKEKQIKNEVKKSKATSLKKLKLLITVVDRSKGLFYLDLLEQFEVNMQTVLYGKGTAGNDIIKYLGFSESEKAVLLSVVREDNVRDIMETLEEKFQKVKNGKGIAFTVPFSSMIGVSMYQFLSNNQSYLKEERNNG